MFTIPLLGRYSALAIFLVAMVSLVQGQAPPPESPEAVKAAMAQHAVAIAEADRNNDVRQAIGSRLALAAMSKPKDAVVLYMRALAIADSAHLDVEAIAARQALARTLAGRGQMKQAYQEAIRAAQHAEVWAADRLAAAEAKRDSLLRAMAIDRDSLWSVSRRAAEMRRSGSTKRTMSHDPGCGSLLVWASRPWRSSGSCWPGMGGSSGVCAPRSWS